MKIEDILKSDNLAKSLSGKELLDIGREAVDAYTRDKESRSEWETTYEDANKLALQMKEDKNTPYPGASNVKFPLLTTAAIQFNARAMPFIMNNGNIVKCKVIGKDEGGKKASQAARKSAYMNWQLNDQDEGWEEDNDRMTMVLPIVGTAYKKSYYDPQRGHNVSELVLASDLVVDYWARSIVGARKTHVLKMTDRQVMEKMRGGLWNEFALEKAPAKTDVIDDGESKRAGKSEPSDDDAQSRRLVLEQYTFLDLDDDGYDEPYIVTVDEISGKVFRIVANFSEVQRDVDAEIMRLAKQARDVAENPEIQDFDKNIILKEIESRVMALDKKARISKIDADELFTAYKFMPSPDGSSILGLGFGVFLGPINHSVDTIINQLIDAGSLQNSNSGFIGRGARIKGGSMSFKRNEWKPVNVAGGALRENLVPLPANAPSAVLFNLLGLLIQYAERISSVSDMMVGETPGQNTPATTSMAALEQGMKTFQGIFKRMHRSLRNEIRALYRLNYIYLDEKNYAEVLDEELEVLQEDFKGDPKDISPAADASSVTNGEQMMKAQFLVERSKTTPGYDSVMVEKRLHAAMNIADTQEIFPLDEEGKPAIQPAPDPKLQLDAADQERKTAESESRARVAMFDSETRRLSAEADAALKEAQTILVRVQAVGAATETDLKAIDRAIALAKEKREALSDRQQKGSGSGGVAGASSD